MNVLVRGIHAEFTPAEWSGQDTSGIRVVGKTVLVLMDAAAPKSSGDVILPEPIVENLSAGAESGVIVAVSPGAFLLNEDMTPWVGEKPAPGDRVYIAKYAGQLVRGRDGRIYRLMDYGNIGAVYDRVAVTQPAATQSPRTENRRHGRSKRARTRR